jgi:hypothetical protein
MICPNCNMMREDSGAPCSYCGASSPVSGTTQAGIWGRQEPQIQVSLVPAPYQGQMGMQQMPMMGQGGAGQVMPIQRSASLASTPAQAEEATIVYVPPMYTKPRAIIPRYRIISGFLSLLIVSCLLCVGAGYYVKASGKLDYLRQMLSGAPPASLHAQTEPDLPDPGTRVDQGPAYAMIPSAIITAHVDPTNRYFAIKPDTVFKVGEIFYVIYSVQSPKTQGVVMLKWYTNNMFFTQTVSQPIQPDPNGIYYGRSQMQYELPAEGKVELYWNNQLAQTLYFVVRP